jgi:hypothetical protein
VGGLAFSTPRVLVGQSSGFCTGTVIFEEGTIAISVLLACGRMKFQKHTESSFNRIEAANFLGRNTYAVGVRYFSVSGLRVNECPVKIPTSWFKNLRRASFLGRITYVVD